MTLLVVYYRDFEFPSRRAITDHLYCFRNRGDRCFYVNAAFRRVPRFLLRAGQVDAILFHNTLLIERITAARFERLLRRLEPLARLKAVRGALVQDEHLLIDRVHECLRRWRVSRVFSVAPTSQWPLLYAGLDGEIHLHQVLTGYLDEVRVHQVNRLLLTTNRSIDVGYRANRPGPWLGSHGALKGMLAGEARRQAAGLGLSTDISIEPEQQLLGDAWFDFLARCRYVLGVEGGSSVLDRDGTLRASLLEGDSLPSGRDGELRYFALSPRHLEACLTRTGQILVEGEYGGILRPWEHYLPLRRDLSNMAEMLSLARDEELRLAMVGRAYQDVVLSGRYSSESFALQVREALGGGPPTGRDALERWHALLDLASWGLVAFWARGVLPLRRLLKRWATDKRKNRR